MESTNLGNGLLDRTMLEKCSDLVHIDATFLTLFVTEDGHPSQDWFQIHFTHAINE